MTDHSQQIATLRALRATVTDASHVAVLDATIAQLEAAEGVPPAPPTIEQRTIATSGGDYGEGGIDKRQGTFYEAQVQHFFLAAGTPDPSAEQRTLLVRYLDGLVARCERLRITGMVERERTQGKAPRVTLSQVYVALAATTWQTVAEADTPDALRDALAAGDVDRVLPRDARRLVEPHQMEGIGWATGR